MAELLKSQANIETRDDSGDTPLHDAARNGHLHVVKALLRAGALVAASNNEVRRGVATLCPRPDSIPSQSSSRLPDYHEPMIPLHLERCW